MKETPEPYPTPEESIATMVTIADTALVFEGGGMRNAYTAALVSRLIAEGINFPHISGVSAGSSHLCNFTPRDAPRPPDTFVDLVEDPEFGGLKHFRKGHGYFNAEYIYQQICYPDGALPFNMATFLANPALTRVATFTPSRGEERWFAKEEMSTLDTLGPIIRASSTLPILMPPVEIDGQRSVFEKREDDRPPVAGRHRIGRIDRRLLLLEQRDHNLAILGDSGRRYEKSRAEANFFAL